MAAAKEVIVVGAGIVGASIAWHLARAGAAVTVIEAGQPGGVATPCSFGWINASWGNPHAYFRLRLRAMAEWSRLKGDLPELPLTWSGGLLWDMPAAGLKAYAEEHRAWGYGSIRMVERAEIARIEPNLAKPPKLAVYVAEEGVAEPAPTARLLARGAQRRGARLMVGVTATAIARRNGRSVVETASGPVEADTVVIAAGTATQKLAATAGVDVPLKHSPGLLAHSMPYRRALNGLVLGDKAHIRQSEEGRLVAGADFGGTEIGDDAQAAAAQTFADMQAMLRGGEDLEPDFHAIGYRAMPLDEFPVIGAAGDGVYIAVMHSGVTLAAAVGLFATQEILAGKLEPLLAPYRPDRFAEIGGGP